MQVAITIGEQTFNVNLYQPIDISIPLHNGPAQVKAFGALDVQFDPLVAGNFVGAVSRGAPVNFMNLRLNPHGNGTHTECIGHIFPLKEDLREERHTIHKCLKRFHFLTELLSVKPEKQTGDQVITLPRLKAVFQPTEEVEALIIRTLPNDKSKKTKDYTGTNPPYLTPEAVEYLCAQGVEHLLIDLPSVDKEEDGGRLAAHHAFWKHRGQVRDEATITELIYVPDAVKDGLYFLQLQIASLELDASPSKPVLYELL